ncbi:MAG: CHC2 zinc finger domain-containing protein [Desulfobacteraceae bacterium]|jgi:hypothetical protein
MVEKKGKKKSKRCKYDIAAIKQVWGQIDVADWYNMVRTAFPASRWTCNRQIIKGQCPFHQDQTPSFVIDLNKKYAKCYSSNCGKFFWDPVRFYMAIQNTPMAYGNALMDMKNRFNIQMSKTIINKIGERQKHREMKKLLFEVMRGELVDCYAQRNSSTPDIDLFYAQNAIDYLNKRGIPPVYHVLPIGVYPNKLRLEKLVKQRVALLGTYMADIWKSIVTYLDLDNRSLEWVGSLVFFTGSSPQDISRIKLRQIPKPRQNFAHTLNDDKKICFIHDDHESENGIFGLFGTAPYQPFLARDDVKSFYYMEGEFDALSIFATQFDKDDYGFFAFSGGGGSAQGLDTMRHFGFDTSYVIGDYDNAGKAWVQRILESTQKIATRVFIWPQPLLNNNNNGLVTTTDPAEALNTVGYDILNREFRKEQNFIKPYQWAINQATTEMNGIARDDIRHLTSIAVNWGKFVTNTAEQYVYANEISKNFGINNGQILADIRAGEEDEEAFIERIRDYLTNRLHILQRYYHTGSHILRVYDTVSKSIYDIPIEEKIRIAANVGAMTGKDILQFIREDIGEPTFLEVDKDSGKQVYISLSNKCMDYVKAAITRLSGNAINNSMIKSLSTGLHCVMPTTDNLHETFRLYHVNGLQMARGDFDSSGKLTWKNLNGPADDSVIIHAEGDSLPKIFMPQIKSADDLNKEPEYSAEELFDIIYKMLNVGWDFKNHKTTCELLTAFCMSLPIANCVSRQPLLMITSEYSSGKSSILGGFIGKSNLPRINIIQSSVYTDNYTVAGIRQLANRSSLCVCIDEFEDKGGTDRRSTVIKGLLQLFRGHSNEEGLTVLGSTSGKHRSFYFHSPVIVAGIRGLQEAADISRFIKIEMDKKKQRDAPQTVLLKKFGEELIRKVRVNLPLVMYRKAKEFHEAYKRIETEYQDGGGLEYGRITRTREHFYSMMAIMAICGKNYHRFIHTYFRQHRHELQGLSQISLSDDLLTELLHTPAIAINDPNDNRPKSLNNILSSGNPEMINQTYCGIYYDRETKWLAVCWPTVKGTKLLNGQEFRNRDAHWLKTNASRNKYHVPEFKIERSGILNRLTHYMGNAAFRTYISIFDAVSLVSDATNSRTVSIIRGHETIDMLSKYGEMIDKRTHPKPPKPQNSKNKDVYNVSASDNESNIIRLD